MDFVLHAYFGLYCGACLILLNTKAGTPAEPCHGCKSEQPTGYCAVRGIKVCARGRGHAFCNECPEYEGCALMEKFLKDGKWPYQQAAARNLESIRQLGISAWLEAQERRWSVRAAMRLIRGGMMRARAVVNPPPVTKQIC